jgi:hypothetical protein
MKKKISRQERTVQAKGINEDIVNPPKEFSEAINFCAWSTKPGYYDKR